MNANLATVASLVVQAAEDRTIEACIEAGFRELGLEKIEGLPISQWMAKRRSAEWESVLLAMGDTNPPLHDAVRACIDEAVKKSKPAG